MVNSEDLSIEFESQTLADIFLAVSLCEVEISGLAKVTRDGHRFKVFDGALIFKQTCSLARTEPNIESLNLWFNNIASSGDQERIQEMESYKLWWHSHVWFEVYFSDTDHRTMRNLLSGFDKWWLVFVANKRNKSRLALVEMMDGLFKYEEAHIKLNPEITQKEFMELMSSREEAIRQAIKQRVQIFPSRNIK